MNSPQNSAPQLPPVPPHLAALADTLVAPVRETLQRFLGGRGKLVVKVHEDPTQAHFTFSPATCEYHVPQPWLAKYSQLQASGDLGGDYTQRSFRMSSLHEASHYRDLLLERELEGIGAMLETLRSIGKRGIKYGKDQIVPVGQNFHALYNCVDDVVVNREAQAYRESDMTDAQLAKWYKEILFREPVPQAGGPYDENGDWVGEGKGAFGAQMGPVVDYSKMERHKAFAYKVLRGNMVRDQQITLPQDAADSLLDADGREAPIRRAFGKAAAALEAKFQATSADPKTADRAAALKVETDFLVAQLKGLADQKGPAWKREVLPALTKCIHLARAHKSHLAESITPSQLAAMFTASDGSGDDHRLRIMPKVRYDAVKLALEPIHKAFILMDLLEQDLKQDKSKGKSGGPGEPGEGGKGDPHESPELDDKIKALEEAQKIAQEEKGQSDAKKAQQKTKEKLASVFDQSEFTDADLSLLAKVRESVRTTCDELADHIERQLRRMDPGEQDRREPSRRGRLDAKAAGKLIVRDPEGEEAAHWTAYTRNLVADAPQEKFKKIDFSLLLDISGSMGGYKGTGILNQVAMVLSDASKKIESKAQALTGDGTYEVPLHYLLYGNDIAYDLRGSPFEGRPHEAKVAKLIKEVQDQSGATADEAAWRKVAENVDEFLSKNPAYVEEVKSGKRRPVVVQIADSDVSEDGVEHLENLLREKYGPEVERGFWIKRVILGNFSEEIVDDRDGHMEELAKKGGRWAPEKLPDGRWRVRQVNVKSQDDILEQLKRVFDAFFDDVVTKA